MRKLTLGLFCVLISFTGSACGGYSDTDREVVSEKSLREKDTKMGSNKEVSQSAARQKEEVKKGSTKALAGRPKENDKPSDNKQSRVWKRGTFRGLTVGKSTEEDLLRVLGKSNRGDPTSQTLYGITWYLYYTDIPFKGRLNIEVNADTKKIEHISFSPMNNLSVDEAIKHYGENYVVTKYASDVCLEDFYDEAGAPSYESPEGNHSLIEYRSLGIAISSGISMGGQETVTSIDYRYGPFGTEKSQCLGGLSLAVYQLHFLRENGKLVNPKNLGFPVGHSYYNFEMQIKGKDFRIWTTPKKYGQDGKISYYFDTATCRRHGKDKGGKKANSKDPVIPATVYKPRADLDSIEVPIEDLFKDYYPCSQKVEEKMNETELGWQSWYVDHRTNEGMAVWKLVQDDDHQ